ncbi:MAG: hypothetical protein WAM82_36765 [Thermoanaerobaculia bacterium]
MTEEMDPFVMVLEQLKELQDRQRQLNEKGFKKGYGEGFKAGHKEEREEMLAEVRAILLHELANRFGDLLPEARLRVEQLVSFEKIVGLSFVIGTAPDLAALGLTGP